MLNYNYNVYQHIKLGIIIKLIYYIKYIIKILQIIIIYVTHKKK